jgi:histidine ammonia-lyase
MGGKHNNWSIIYFKIFIKNADFKLNIFGIKIQKDMPNSPSKLYLNKKIIKIEDVVAVAKNRKIKIKLPKDKISNIKSSRVVLEEFVKSGKIIYGVTTGFGDFKDKIISKEDAEKLQENLIMSHSIGTGTPLSEEIVRAVIFLMINSLSKGQSGVRLEVIKNLIKILNKGIYPFVPEKGSVGASGDLAPLAHIALILIGKGETIENGKRIDAKKTLLRAKIKPIKLSYKEGLALINGTHVMTAIASLNLYEAERLIKIADIAGAMSLEACKGNILAFDKRISQARPHKGQIYSAYNIRRLCQGSELLESHKNQKKIQDSYSLRCIPQVHGACREALNFARKIVETEINSITDNPIIFHKEKIILSGGNFHGDPIGLAMETLGIALSIIGNISERRTAKLLDPNTNGDLPSFLIDPKKAGLCSGYMLAQYTAASLVAENKVLSHPVVVDSIPTSANQEDYVSFGTIAAKKSREIIENTKKILAIELMCAAQAVDFRKPSHLGKGTEIAYRKIRKYVKALVEDRILYRDLEKMCEIIDSGELLDAVERNCKLK